MFKDYRKIQINKRRTFAIISHPDAGKSTLTEKFLFLGNIIRQVGMTQSKKSKNYIKSDWMKIEKKRGISITTSVMQIPYCGYLINLLDTPGHEDFSEDTYRVLTAVDFCLMVIDSAKGIEERTKKLIDVTRTYSIPIITFFNKLDRNSIDFIELIDQLERELKMVCSPITWPIDYGNFFTGIYHILEDIVYFNCRQYVHNDVKHSNIIHGLNNVLLDDIFGNKLVKQFREEIELIKVVYRPFNHLSFLHSNLTPVFFGSALKNFGVSHVLDSILKWAPPPTFKISHTRKVKSSEKKFSGFVFKIQANMDLKHRDRIAFIRIVSGEYEKGMKLYHVRTKKFFIKSEAFSFLAGTRFLISQAYPGDIIGIHSHNKIKIGDTFTEGENLKFLGISKFSPDIFKLIYLDNSLKKKQLLKGLIQLSEEGAIQVFRPITNNSLILGAIGDLQFDIVVERLKIEYNICIIYKKINVFSVRWIEAQRHDKIIDFKERNKVNLAVDIDDNLVYLSTTSINLSLIQARYPHIIFRDTCEY
ncbi:MAG: peptide chain release factor 3 [Buchnera aphidicola (Schlechtendalia peitan)]